MERCRSGRTGRTRNAVNGQLFRGFESLSLRSNGCKSSSYEIYTLFYTQKSRLGVFFFNFYDKCWRKKKNECLSLFASIFFECCQRENKFSPFWVYSQWNKLNLSIKNPSESSLKILFVYITLTYLLRKFRY